MKLLNEDKKRESRKKLQANAIYKCEEKKGPIEGHSEVIMRERERPSQEEVTV